MNLSAMNILFQDPQREKELLTRFLFFPQDHFYIRKINESLFGSQLHQQIFCLIKELYEKHNVITPTTLTDYIIKFSQAPNNDQLLELIANCQPSAIKAEEHIPHLTDIWYRRKLKGMTDKVASMLLHIHSEESILNYIRKEINEIGSPRDSETLEEITEQAYAKIIHALQNGPNIIDCGLKGINQAIGLTESLYVLICGKSSEGKSSLVNQLIINMLSLNKNVSVLYLSMEINTVKLMENLVSILTQIPKDRLRGKGIPLKPHEVQLIKEALDKIKTFDLEIEYGSVSAEEAALLIDLFVAKKRSQFGESQRLVIVADHHLYIKVEGYDQQKSINDFSKMLVQKKEEHRLLAILLCQLHNRHTEEYDHAGKPIPPALKWIQYPGTLQQDCDSSIAIWRRNRQLSDEEKLEVEKAELWIEKNRDGQSRIGIPVQYIAKYSQFEDAPVATYVPYVVPFDSSLSSREKEMPLYEDFE